MRIIVGMAAFLLLVTSAFGFVTVSSLDLPDVQEGYDYFGHITLKDSSSSRAHVQVVFPELGIRGTEGPQSVRSYDTMLLHVPEYITPGFHTVRVRISGDNGKHRVVHREILVRETYTTRE